MAGGGQPCRTEPVTWGESGAIFQQKVSALSLVLRQPAGEPEKYCHYHSNTLLLYLYEETSDYFFNVCRICNHVPFFIPDTGHLCLLPFTDQVG